MTRYREFLAGKARKHIASGIEDVEIDERLFPFQRQITRWALKHGRAAIFADCGLGKTPMQLEWARHVCKRTGGPVLILAPLAVSAQTVREGVKFDVPVTICRGQSDARGGVNITNYEMLEHFDPQAFRGIVLDESSILKSFGGVTRKAITEFSQSIEFRLACTATPAPNDLIELTNHAEFLDIMSGKEIIALYFTQDGNSTHHWRLKGHAKTEFWRWMASWSVACRRPSDLGFDDDDFLLPPLNLRQHEVDSIAPPPGMLFRLEASTLMERRQARSASVEERCAVAARLANESDEQWLIWCGLNKESELIASLIPGAIEVTGSDSVAHKESALLGFAAGRIRVLVSKPSIAGFGMNFQSCHNMAFVGLSDSYEQYYQAMRRCWRFGQKSPVNVHVIISETEGAVVRNIERKEQQAMGMFDEIVAEMRDLQLDRSIAEAPYEEDRAWGEGWQMELGDSCETIKRVESESVGLSIFSPPFPGMYAYSNSRHDIGNTTTIDQMIEHFSFLPEELLRITMPGRLCCIHLMQLTAMKSREGYIGLHDYRGRVIEMMIQRGWRYAGEVTIDKNPQIQATRNKERGLLFKSLATDSSMMRMALADYLIYFRKDGENPEKIRAGVSERYNNPEGWITEKEWIEWAAPVWYRQTKDYPGGIRETDVLNVRQARETDDERHLCPLQLGVIERAVKLWSNPGDLVYSPFAGIGSEGYVALRLGRRFRGCELKRSYYETSIENLRSIEGQSPQGMLL